MFKGLTRKGKWETWKEKEAKEKNKDNGTNSPEYLASAYLKNILNHD